MDKAKKKYAVHFTVNAYGTVYVEAEDEGEAEEIAQSEWLLSNIHIDEMADEEIEVLNITEEN